MLKQIPFTEQFQNNVSKSGTHFVSSPFRPSSAGSRLITKRSFCFGSIFFIEITSGPKKENQNFTQGINYKPISPTLYLVIHGLNGPFTPFFTFMAMSIVRASGMQFRACALQYMEILLLKTKQKIFRWTTQVSIG